MNTTLGRGIIPWVGDKSRVEGRFFFFFFLKEEGRDPPNKSRYHHTGVVVTVGRGVSVGVGVRFSLEIIHAVIQEDI